MSVPSSFALQTEWKYAALGDSLATGYLAQSGYVSRYRDHVQTDTAVPVTLYNLGQNGATSARLLTLLRTDTVVQSAVDDGRHPHVEHRRSTISVMPAPVTRTRSVVARTVRTACARC